MNNNLIKYIDRDYHSNRLSHAFLVCNTFFDNIKDDLEYVLSNYFFDKEIKLDNNPDIYVIKPENGKILKDEIIKLQESFMTYSLINKNRVYIIDEAEKMNQHASNSLLKFLEEPSDNIYAILISSNINRILPTIKSRCQVLMIDNQISFNLKNYDIEYIKKILNIIVLFEKDGLNSLPFLYQNLDKKIDKEDLKNMIKVVKYFYEDCLNSLLQRNLCYFSDFNEFIEEIVKINNSKKLVNKLYIILKEESKLNYNVNSNLFLDNLFIKMEEI